MSCCHHLDIRLDTELTAEGGVKVNSFAPIHIVETFDWIMAAVVAALLISNILRMYYKIIWKNSKTKVSLWVHIREFWLLIFNFAVQPKFSKCDDKSYWLSHWLLMSGYTIMFIVIVVYLPWFQTEKILPVWNPQRLLGYYATFGLAVRAFCGISAGRIRGKDIKFQFSHVSDWLFLVMLTLTVITGILIHIFRINGMPYGNLCLLYRAHGRAGADDPDRSSLFKMVAPGLPAICSVFHTA